MRSLALFAALLAIVVDAPKSSAPKSHVTEVLAAVRERFGLDPFYTNAPPGGVHNDIDTREELAEYDPDLFKLINEAFKGTTWRYVRYDKRNASKVPDAQD